MGATENSSALQSIPYGVVARLEINVFDALRYIDAREIVISR